MRDCFYRGIEYIYKIFGNEAQIIKFDGTCGTKCTNCDKIISWIIFRTSKNYGIQIDGAIIGLTHEIDLNYLSISGKTTYFFFIYIFQGRFPPPPKNE